MLTMKLILCVTLICMTLNFTHGAVSIVSTSTTLTLGTSVQITCKVTPLTNTITWGNLDGTLTDCLSNSDNCVPPTVGRYTFSSDYVNAEYYLNINSVTIDDQTDFTCTQATSPLEMDTQSFIVKLTTTDDPMIVEGISPVSLTATSSCIFPTSDYQMTWYTVKTSGGSESIYDKDSSFFITSSIISDCGSAGGKKIVNSFEYTSPSSSQTSDVFFIAKFFYNGVVVSSKQTINSYKIEEADDKTHDSGLSDAEIAGIVIGSIAGVAIICATVFLYVKFKG